MSGNVYRVTRFVVNGVERSVDSDPATPLIQVLRSALDLRGVRPGCAIGECGACAVLVDDRPVRSCQTPLSEVEGTTVTTPEGLDSPVRQAFLDEQAAQCGYCVNGIMMSVAGVLRTNPAAEPADARAALSDHLCRCGTHHRILRAVDRLVGAPVRDPDAVRRPPESTADADADQVPDPPGALRGAPNIEDWVRALPDGRIEVRSGRVELGQGVRTSIGQIAAAEIGVPVDQVVVRSAATDGTPDEGYTAGSASLEQGGEAVARAAAAYRRRREAGEQPTGPITSDDVPRWSGYPLGEPVDRTDLVEKLTGAAYLHDLVLPGMLHARALLPPTYDARPLSLDVEAVRSIPGVLTVVRDGGVLIVLAETEPLAVRGVERLARSAVWEDPGLAVGPPLRERPATTHPVLDEPGVGAGGGRTVTASYAKPYEAHGSMAPSCAVAQFDDEGYTVWTHSQGVYPLRRELAAMSGEDESRVVVRHLDGPGCYGHNGADDAAGFAVRAARAVPGRPVRFQFSLSDELGWEPYGSQMSGDLSATLDDQNALSSWRYVVRTDAHTARPHGTGDRLVAAWLSADGPERPWAGTGEGGVRNAVPIYAVPARHVSAEYARGPLRTSALRTLGAYFNLFAIESFMDELAEAAGVDPVAFRLAHLRDERAREVLRTVVDAVDWRERVGPSGRGIGVAVARYKSSKAYVAQAVEVRVDTTTGSITVPRVVTACDAGGIVNPDGLRNQLEGGTLQGLSRALHEEVRYGSSGVESRDWTSYPVLRFAEVPDLRTILLDRPGHRPLGAGEASTPVTPAALANAVDDAVGIRVRKLPLTPERLRSRLEELTDEELERVRV